MRVAIVSIHSQLPLGAKVIENVHKKNGATIVFSTPERIEGPLDECYLLLAGMNSIRVTDFLDRIILQEKISVTLIGFPDEIRPFIDILLKGKCRFNLLVSSQQIAPRIEDDTLSERERTVLIFVSNGLSKKEIAECFSVEESTVKRWLNNISNKLGMKTRAGMVAVALRNGLIP